MKITSRIPSLQTDPPSPAHTCERLRVGSSVHGVRIDALDRDMFLDRLTSFRSCPRSHVVHFLASDPTVRARSDPRYREVLNAGDLNVADGLPVALAARVFGWGTQRITGTDSFPLVVEWGLGSSVSHYLLGSTDTTLTMLREQLVRRHPGVAIAGVESPPFRDLGSDELDAIAARLRMSGADIVWIGMGAPKQDLFAAELQMRNAAPVLLCVGAAFDFVAGAKRRAPRWMRAVGLEWLFRLGIEPRRLWRRYIIGNPRFVAGVVVDGLRSMAPRGR